MTVADVCGSELHGWDGRTPRSGAAPATVGHEMKSRVAKRSEGCHIL